MAKPIITDIAMAVVLEAVAELEGWDAEHPSIALTRNNGWDLMDVRGVMLPAPSSQLRRTVRLIEKRVHDSRSTEGRLTRSSRDV